MTQSPVIYQIYPRSFKDTIGTGTGDLRGIIEQLDYIASLGVDYVWISPFFCSPQKDFGYDVSDYRTVDPVYGTNEDFDRLIAEATKRGLKIMVDIVLAHTSDQHEWFQNSKSSRTSDKTDWYIWADPKPDGTAPNNWMSVFGGPAWTWDSGRRQYYHHQFLKEQPCLNFHTPVVQEAMIDVFRYWINKGVKGFRIDAIYHAFVDEKLRDNAVNPVALSEKDPDIYNYQLGTFSRAQPEGIPFIQTLRDMAGGYPDIYLMGEMADRIEARKYTGLDKLHSCYFFDFLQHKGTLNAVKVQKTIDVIRGDFPDYDFCWSLSNHDFARHVSRFASSEGHEAAFAKLCAALFLTLPGGYCLYQGEELGLPAANLTYDDLVDPFDRSIWPEGQQRDRARTPMPWRSDAPQAGFSTAAKTWLPIDPRHYALSPSAQEQDPNSTLNFIRRTLALRRNHPALQGIGFEWLESGNKDVLAYKRNQEIANGTASLTGYFNISEKPCNISLPHGVYPLSEVSQIEAQTDTEISLPAYGFILCNA